ncbi:MAG: glycoside hydrolase, partial [Mesorhizobium sp.]|nr:glycoside hydrolase [Mesorhizobium sp.]
MASIRGNSIRRIAALILAAAVAACTTADNAFRDLSPNATAPAQSSTGNPRFGDRDPHEWASITPWRYAIHGTDVSKYQRSIDWGKARAAG